MAITPDTIAATPDEYDFDSSDEEDVRNTVGNIPMQWYANLGHIGYDTSGRPIMKSRLGDSDVGDKIDEYLSNVSVSVGESGMEWRTVRDPLTDQLVILGDQDLETVIRIAAGKGVSEGTEPFEPWNEWFSKDVLQMPVTAHPPQKRSFIPSLLDRRRVGRMVHAIKMGWLKPNLPAWALSDTEDPDGVRRYAAYLTGGNLGALDSDDEEDTLGIPASSIPNYVFPDIWSDLNDGTTDATTTKGPPSLSDLLHNNYRPPRPRPYQRAPEEPLPGHIASYNPPPEFLLTKEERKRVMSMWRDRVHDGHVSRIPPLMPEQFACLRHVPFSERYLREREERVKDLLMAARVEKQRLATTPEALLPPIPSLADLRPYPSHAGLVYRGHVGRVTDVAVSSCGQWVASISPIDGFLRIWETATNYCFRAYQLRASASTKADKSKRPKVAGDDDEEEGGTTDTACVSWNPKPELCLIAASIGDIIYLINPSLGDRVRVQQTNSGLLQWWNSRSPTELMQVSDDDTSSEVKRSRLDENIGDTTAQATPQWSFSSASSDKTRNSRPSKITEGHRVTICLNQPICSLDWHPKGDYLLSLSRPVLSSEILSKSIERIYLHRLSKMSSQAPFAMPSRSVEWRQVQFHPAGKPHVFVASPREIRVYDLLQQKELRCLRLDGSSDTLSRMAVHPSGDHLVAGTFDGRFQWFDIDLGNVPFKKMGLGHGAVRNLDVHHTRPLVSVAMDDGTVLVVHATVSDDLLSKPLIIPVTLIRTGQPSTAASVLATTFHPRQPHMYTGGADGSVRQFVAWR
ncbi:Ribosome biogenesis protein bop1 [Fasciola hepatica]|uniref:Ribosome biogenesis protein bop1 n=1 Tax=Fasciola hepatica TaxID=6192 RepID=A0A4E0RZK6_FASHE|nr:Ribosome biogenesis protein bop1 [Fasciola hepatica]